MATKEKDMKRKLQNINLFLVTGRTEADNDAS